MSRKDYQAVAECLRSQAEAQETYQSSGEERLHFVALALCDVFARDNPRFDAARFMRATERVAVSS